MVEAKILVVEDENIVALDLESRLGSLGYAVPAVVASGEEAIQKTAETRPDLVLMDIRLKGEMDGIEAAEEIWARFDIPVVYMTALADDDTVRRARMTGPFGYLIKPFDERELHVIIEIALYKHGMEKALRESERRYRLLAENVLDVIWTTDLNLQPTYISPSVSRLLGYDVEEAMTQTLEEHLTPASLEVATKALKKTLVVDDVEQDNLSGSQTLEFEFIRKDGSTVWTEVKATLLRDPDGWPVGILGITRDITERRRAEEALRQRNRELALLNQVGQTFVSTLELDQLLITVLEEVRRLLGVVACSIWLTDPTTDELVCRQATGPQSEIVRGWRLAPGQGLAGRVARSGESLIVPDIRADARHFKGVDQQTGLALRSILTVPLRIKNDVIGVLQAVDAQVGRFSTTDLMLVESLAPTAAMVIENAQLYEQARKDAKTKTVLLREVNHRVKNNLAAIVGLLYAERRHVGVENRVVYQSIMKDLINRVQSLATVHSLLSASEWAPLRLSDLVTQVIRSALQTLPRDKHVLVEVPPSPVRVTPKQAQHLGLVINELATNTAKYALQERDTAQITVHIALDDDATTRTVRCEFRDDGPGYPEDVLRLERHNVGFDVVQSVVRDGLRGELSLHNDHGAMSIIRFKARGEDQVGWT